MKSNSISTYWAKKLKIKAIQGHSFEFSLNLKNDDGSKYILPDNHVAFFGVYKEIPYTFQAGPYASENNGMPLMNTGWLESYGLSNPAPIYYIFNTTIEAN